MALAESLEKLSEESICGTDGISLAFNVGVLSIEGGEAFEFALVAIDQERALCCFPGGAWHKKTGSRKLPPQAITKAISFSVPGCTDEERLEPAPECFTTVWLGWLRSDLVEHLSFERDVEATIIFQDKSNNDPCYPFADSLAAAAKDRYNVGSEGQDLSVGMGEERIAELEKKFASLQEGLQELLDLHRSGGGYVTAQEGLSAEEPLAASKMKARPKPKPQSAAASAAPTFPPGLDRRTMFPGLDAATVSAALQAGVPVEHMKIMSQALKAKPVKMDDQPGKKDPLLVEDEEEVQEATDQAADVGLDPVQSALVKLTKIVGSLTAKRGDSLEESLDFGSGGSGLEQGGGLSRKHAAVIRALKKTFRENPRKLWQVMEGNMADDFDLRTAQPNAPGATFSARGWAEHRSKIQGYPRTVRAVWGVAGILDSIRAGNIDEARCRCLIMLAQFEQESLDRGSYILAQEFSLEPAPPVSSFNLHQLPEPTEMAYTHILDGRWVESFAHHLRDVDSYMEMRRKLGQKPKAPPPPVPPKAGAKGGGGKGKNKSSSEEQADHQS